MYEAKSRTQGKESIEKESPGQVKVEIEPQRERIILIFCLITN